MWDFCTWDFLHLRFSVFEISRIWDFPWFKSFHDLRFDISVLFRSLIQTCWRGGRMAPMFVEPFVVFLVVDNQNLQNSSQLPTSQNMCLFKLLELFDIRSLKKSRVASWAMFCKNHYWKICKRKRFGIEQLLYCIVLCIML